MPLAAVLPTVGSVARRRAVPPGHRASSRLPVLTPKPFWSSWKRAQEGVGRGGCTASCSGFKETGQGTGI